MFDEHSLQEELQSFYVRALFDYQSQESNMLSFRAGCIIEVLSQLENGWWDGLLDENTRGWFPSNYVELVTDEEAALARSFASESRRPSSSSSEQKSSGPVETLPMRVCSQIEHLIKLTSEYYTIKPDIHTCHTLMSQFLECTKCIVHDVRLMMSNATIVHIVQLPPDSLYTSQKPVGEDLRSLCDMLPILLSRLTNQMRELTNIIYRCALNAKEVPWSRYQEVQKDTHENAIKLLHAITSLKQKADLYLLREEKLRRSMKPQRISSISSNNHLERSSQVIDDSQSNGLQGIGLSVEVHALLTADLIPSPRNAGSRSYASERKLDFKTIYFTFTHHLQSLKQILSTPQKVLSSSETPWLDALRDTLEYAGLVLILLDDIDLANSLKSSRNLGMQANLSDKLVSRIYGYEQYQSSRQRFANSANSCLVVAQRILDLRYGSTPAAYHELANKIRLLEEDASTLLQSLQQCLLHGLKIPLTTVPTQHLQEEPTSSKSSGPSPLSSSQTWASNTGASLSSIDSSQRGIDMCTHPRLKTESFASSTECTKGLVWGKDNLIKGGTFTALVDYLLNPCLDNEEHEFSMTFLATLPTFATTEQLLEVIITRYRIHLEIRDDVSYREDWIALVQQPNRLRILSVLIDWLDDWWLIGEYASLDVLLGFIQEQVAETIYSEAKNTLLRLIHRRKQGLSKPLQFPKSISSIPFPILPGDFKTARFKDMNPLEVARQVTLLESKQFCRIKFIEWLSRAFSQPSLQPEKQEISEMIALHNKASVRLILDYSLGGSSDIV